MWSKRRDLMNFVARFGSSNGKGLRVTAYQKVMLCTRSDYENLHSVKGNVHRHRNRQPSIESNSVVDLESVHHMDHSCSST